MVYFHDYPDVTIHTQKDQPENLDATKLGRVAYIGAGIVWTLAALPDSEAPRCSPSTRADVESAPRARGAAPGPDAAARAPRGDRRRASRRSSRSRGSGRRRAAAVAADVRAPARAPTASAAAGVATGAIAGPARNPEIVGPLERLLLRLLRRHPGRRPLEDRPRRTRGRRRPRLRGAQPRRREAVDLARSATCSRAATRPSPSPPIAEYFELLARAGAVSFRLRIAQIASIALPDPAALPRRNGDRDRPADARPRRARPRRHALRFGRFADARRGSTRSCPRATQDDPAARPRTWSASTRSATPPRRIAFAGAVRRPPLALADARGVLLGRAPRSRA